MRALPAALVLAISACATAAPNTVLLVRHAERDPGKDPDLNEAGRLRAEALVDSARRAGVVAVYHTQYKRTKQTAEPVALALRIPMVQVDIAPNQEAGHAEAVLRSIDAHYRGKPVLVVEHSNTIPILLKKLGAASPREIPETEYGTLFIVSDGKVSEEKFGD